jgi:hypothetical protein
MQSLPCRIQAAGGNIGVTAVADAGTFGRGKARAPTKSANRTRGILGGTP